MNQNFINLGVFGMAGLTFGGPEKLKQYALAWGYSRGWQDIRAYAEDSAKGDKPPSWVRTG